MSKKQDLPKVAIAARAGVKSEISATALQRWNPEIRAAADESTSGANTISILDPIGADVWGEGVTAKRVGAALRAMNGRDVVININSPGGSFFEGLAIYSLLREYEGHVTAKILGIAASAASIIAMAADEIQIGRAAFLMIHNTQVLAGGDRHAFTDVIEYLEPFDAALSDIYATRTGLDASEIAAMLDKETWIGGAKAVDQKFADSLLSSDEVDEALENAQKDLSPLAALKKIEAALAGRMSRSESRAAIAALKESGTPSAVLTGMPSAALTDLAATLETLKTL